MTSPDPKKGPELFFGFVGPVGTNTDLLCETLQGALDRVKYKTVNIHLIKLVNQILGNTTDSDPSLFKQYDANMTTGNRFREITDNNAAVTLLGLVNISKNRKNSSEESPNHAYILRSLKRQEEVNLLEKIYQRAFFLIAAYSPRETRVVNLTHRIAKSMNQFDPLQFRHQAEQLVARDEQEKNIKWGQNVQDTFPRGHVFIDSNDKESLTISIERFINLLFGHPFITPSRDEYAMFHAYAAAMRSSSLGRQVGAAISTSEGDIIAVGSNEVPKAGGGLYWEGDDPDHRDHIFDEDPSDSMKKTVLANLLKKLCDAGWLKLEISNPSENDLAELALKRQIFKGTHLANLIEFGRPVHAEMAALLDAARRGVSVKGHALFTTTFPCHDCAKHIVAAGIKRVVYIEPYPKSLVTTLYPDSIAVDPPYEDKSKVIFQSFVGISPRLYLELFSMSNDDSRKKNGKVEKWDPIMALPKISGSKDLHIPNEWEACNELGKVLEDKKILGGGVQ